MGYRREEYRQLEVPFSERASRFEEAVQLMRELWTKPAVTFEGRSWRLDGATPHLALVQQPTPPIWIGADATRSAGRSCSVPTARPLSSGSRR